MLGSVTDYLDGMEGDAQIPDVKSAQNYYAFGAIQDNPLNILPAAGLTYGFNGKRMDNEWNGSGAR